MDADGVMAWVAGYERRWRDADVDGLAAIFTEDVEYRVSPVEPPLRGLEAVRGIWAEDAGDDFTFAAQPVAVQGDVAVVRAHVHYLGSDRRYVDLWVLRFAGDRRVREFEEWPYWPGRPYTSASDRPLPAADGPSREPGSTPDRDVG